MENKKKEVINSVKEWVICILIAFVIAFLVNKFLIYKVKVPTGSMIPTINEEDQLFVTRVYNCEKLKTGDIVVFYSEENKDTYIKRLIGRPGDTVVINHGTVSVNGKELKEDYVKNNEDFSGTYEVPKGKYFFLGDNRADSYDSRKWVNPYVDEDDIEAKALIRVYPFNNIGFLK